MFYYPCSYLTLSMSVRPLVQSVTGTPVKYDHVPLTITCPVTLCDQIGEKVLDKKSGRLIYLGMLG